MTPGQIDREVRLPDAAERALPVLRQLVTGGTIDPAALRAAVDGGTLEPAALNALKPTHRGCLAVAIGVQPAALERALRHAAVRPTLATTRRTTV